MAKTDLEKEEKRREKIRRENTRRKEKFLETIKDNKKKVGIFKTVNFGQAKLWVILLVIGFVLYKLGLTNGIIGTIAVLSMAIGLALTLSVAFTRIFNGIRIVTLNEDSIIYSDDKNEETAYKNLEYFVLKAPGTKFTICE